MTRQQTLQTLLVWLTTTYDYYVRQDCGLGDFSTWTGPISFTTGGPPPANDLCSGAITLTCGSTVSGTLVDATLDAGLPAGCGGGNGAYVSASVWYQIVGNGQNYEVSLCNANTTIDTKLSVFSGTCGSLVCEDNNDDDGSCGVNTLASTVSFPTQNGVTYYILVHRFSDVAGGTFDISVTCTTCTPAAGNDNCAGAATLTNGVLLATNNTCAGGAPANPSCNGFQSAFDVWYKINSGLSTNMQIDLAAVTASGLRYAVYYGSCGSLTSVYCNTTPPASNTITLLGTPTDYYIQVWSTSVSTRGDFDITATLSGGPCMAANANFVSPACDGLPLGLTSNVTFGTGPYSYQWSGTGTFSPSSTSQNPTVTGAATGNYTVTITDTGNPPCSITLTVAVTVNPVPVPVVQGGNPTVEACEGTSLTLSANNAAGGQTTTYSWTTTASIPFTSSQQTPTVTSSAAGNAGLYTVVLTNQYLCAQQAAVLQP
ncbi:MAG: hypothetical protein IPJ79_00460 [Bacteroidetes bacterium]|nr:hypothetical protein [Bacteroidota bacterium]